MSEIDDLLREFRADVPDPADDAATRIMDRARRAHAQPAAPMAPARPSRPTRARMWRWAALPVAAATAASAVIALAPSRDGAGSPSLLERAEAAITPARRIVALSVQIRSTTTASGVINPERTITMRQWTLVGAERALRARILISEGPLQRPPTDEDSTILTDRKGRVIDQRSWTPLFVKARNDYPRGGGRGELQIGGPRRVVDGGLTLVAQLREAYRNNRVRPSGTTREGDLRFTSTGGPLTGTRSACTRTQFILDKQTLFPRRIEITTKRPPCGTGAPTLAREVWTINVARSLRATPANLRLLNIGPGPTQRIVTHNPRGKAIPLEDAPPIPPLDEG